MAKPEKGLVNFVIYAVDGVHNQRLHRIIDENGFPTEAMVGAEALHALWLLVQHQDYDVRLQELCLKKCGFALPDKAHLTDRVLVSRGKAQRFGTQWYRKNGKFVLRPIENEKKVDALRKEYGLAKLQRKRQ